jgi:ubiquinone/menaquinone biosynthesis C-methylase UbiE
MNEKYNDTALHFDKLTLPGILKRFLQSGPVSIADLGCGDGPWFNLLFKNGYISDEKNVYAVDLEIDRLRRVQDNFPWIIVLASPADEIPMIKSGSLDWIISTMVMEHVPDEPKYLREIARLLNPLGKAYVSTVYKRKWAWYFRKRNGESALDTSHIREYTDLSKFKLLVTEKGGLVITELQISQMWFPLIDPILFRVGKYIRLNKIVIKLLRMVKVPIPGYYELHTILSKKASSAD